MSGSPDRGRRWRRDERGAELVEFSLVFVLFVGICYGLVAFGLAINLKQNLTHAVAEGARAAVGAGGECDPGTDAACADAKKQAALARVTDQLGGQSSSVKSAALAGLTRDIAQCDGGTAECMTVTIVYDYANNAILPSLPGFSIFMPAKLTARSVVQVTN